MALSKSPTWFLTSCDLMLMFPEFILLALLRLTLPTELILLPPELKIFVLLMLVLSEFITPPTKFTSLPETEIEPLKNEFSSFSRDN